MGCRTTVLLIANDVTQRWDAVLLLAQQNEALEQRGQELRSAIENLQTICEAEEIARSKGRVCLLYTSSEVTCCPTPEELFDKLLDAATGYQEYLILREDEMDLLDDAGEKKVEQLRLKYLARREALG